MLEIFIVSSIQVFLFDVFFWIPFYSNEMSLTFFKMPYFKLLTLEYKQTCAGILEQSMGAIGTEKE